MRPELLLVMALLGVTACTRLASVPERAAEPVLSAEALQGAQLGSYADALRRMVTGSVTEQAEVLAESRLDYEQARQGPAVLRYALLLGAPLHAARDPVQAQQLLRESLARPELLSELERALATVELERINAELRIGAENERLLAEAQTERERQRNGPNNTASLTRQVQMLTEQNSALRRSLDEARAKLDQIAEFERRQADRPPASEGL